MAKSNMHAASNARIAAVMNPAPTVASVMAQAEKLDDENLLLLHRQVVDLANARTRRRAHAASMNLARGQYVQWDGRHGHQEGTIESVGPKNSKVRTVDTLWTVGNTMLKPATRPAVAAKAKVVKGFTVDKARLKYSEGRHGVRCVAPILFDGKPAGMLWDEPEQIVAKVEFNNAALETAFLAAARKAGRKEKENTYAVSEHARELVAAAENA